MIVFAFLAVPVGIIVFALKFGRKKGLALQAQVAATKALYDKALFDLQEDPESSQKHQEALARGREYYTYLHPNTYDMNQNGGGSNFRDNAGIVEMKVQADIQARLKKGKVS